MRQVRVFVVRDAFAYGVIVLSALVQLVLLVQPFDFLLTNLLSDDAFYYFQIARHITLGHGPTFDGIHLTNGFHPLWMAILIPVFSLFSTGVVQDFQPIYIALALCLVFNVTTSVVLLHVLRRVTTHTLWLALALSSWSLNPYVLYESLNGLETSLALLMFSLSLLAAVRLVEHPSVRTYLIGGFCVGGMLLARLDMIFYACMFAGIVILHASRIHWIQRVASFAGPVLLCSVPWVWWNAAYFGMFFTSAANSNLLAQYAWLESGRSLTPLVFGLHAWRIFTATTVDVLMRSGTFAVISVLVAWYVYQRLCARRVWRLSPVQRALVLMFFGFCLLFFVHTTLRFTVRSWYFVSFVLFVSLAIGYVGTTVSRTALRHTVVIVSIAALAGSFFYAQQTVFYSQFVHQRGMYDMALYINEHVPPNTRVGVFNAGVQGYFSKVPIVNLDGLVNNSAYEALRTRRLWSYIQQEQIAYISDFDLYLVGKFDPFLDTPNFMKHLESVYRLQVLPSTRTLRDIALYKVTDLAGGVMR